MNTVVETPAYLRAARDAGLTEAERESIVTMVANEPADGDEVVGTGGCRKLRVAGRGKGKSGGYRLITFFSGAHLPVFPDHDFFQGRAFRFDRSGAQSPRKVCRHIER